MSPLMVIRTLAGSQLANLGMVRSYLQSVCQTEQKQIDEHTRIIEQYRIDTKKVRERIHELRSQALTLKQTKCAVCNEILELPTVHFLCEHSFHADCFQSYAESESECPLCYEDNKKILDIVKSQQQSREQHDAFHSQLEKADDGFAVVADYFGRGMFRGLTFHGPFGVKTGDRRAPAPAPLVQAAPKAATSSYLHAPTSAVASAVASAVSNTRLPVLEERPVAVSRIKTPPNPFGTPSPTESSSHNSPLPKASVSSGGPSGSSRNPFGTPEESPAKEQVSANPFGDDNEEEEYDESMNPFAE